LKEDHRIVKAIWQKERTNYFIIELT